MLNKENSEFSFLFSSALNNPVIFITNSTSKEQGSSIYIVHQNGTIRCSGANEGERKATTFIRPYLIGYISSKKEGVIFNQASLGLSPFEARAKNYSELIRMEKNGYGHMGNTITEILSFKNLRSPDFTPSTWKNPGNSGTDWSIARQEVLGAWYYVVANGYDFKEDDHRVETNQFKIQSF